MSVPGTDARRLRDGSPNGHGPEVIVTCCKRRFSGVSATIDALLPVQGRHHDLGYLGVELPAVRRLASQGQPLRRLSLAEALRVSRRPLPDGRPRIWHVRRNAEMALGILARDVLRCPIRLVFTSAAIRRHSLLPRGLIRQMDAVIATSPAAAALVPNVAAVVFHGVDLGRFQPSHHPGPLPGAEALDGKLAIGVLGRVRPEKGIHLFVEALLPLLPRFPDAVAVIGGLCKAQDWAYAAALRRRIADAGLAHRFVWTGEIPSRDMPSWHQRFLVTVACPVYEGFGLTPIEAMASGAAVVATRTGAFEAMVVDGETGRLVPTGDSHALSNAIGSLLANPVETRAMGRRGRARVEALFSIEAEAEAIHRVYRLVWERSMAAQTSHA